MFRYSEGWMWFVSGLALTVAFAALAAGLALVARASERRRARPLTGREP